jgi:hypothetical protein
MVTGPGKNDGSLKWKLTNQLWERVGEDKLKVLSAERLTSLENTINKLVADKIRIGNLSDDEKLMLRNEGNIVTPTKEKTTNVVGTSGEGAISTPKTDLVDKNTSLADIDVTKNLPEVSTMWESMLPDETMFKTPEEIAGVGASGG